MMTPQETIHDNEKLYGHQRIAGRCCKAVSNGPRSFRWHQCRKAAREAGGLFCPQHDPATVSAVRERKHREWKERLERETRKDLAARWHDQLVSMVNELRGRLPQNEDYEAVRIRAKRLLAKIEEDTK